MSQVSDQQSIDKAAEVAQKLAASTNTKANQSANPAASQWPLPYGFNPYLAPPNYGYGQFGFGGYGMQGMNFSCPTPQPPAIPQMQQTSMKDNQASSSNGLPPGFNPAQLSQIPPPTLAGNTSGNNPFNTSSNFSNFSNFANFSQSNQSWGSNQSQNNRNQQNQNAGGPKPIRFSLQPKRGGAHGFGGGKNQTSGNANASGSINASNNDYSSSGNASGLGGQQQGSIGYQNSGVSYAKVAAAASSTSNDYCSNQNNLSNSYASNNANSDHRNVAGQNQKQSQDFAQAMDSSDWPDSLQQYVFRCYELCSNKVDKDRVDIILRGKITRAAQDGVLQTKDWSKEPLPEISGGQVKMLPFAAVGPIKGKITGKPIKTEDFGTVRGGGNSLRGGRGGGVLAGKQQQQQQKGRGNNNNKWGSATKGRGGRNVFRSTSKSDSPSRSRSRSRSSDSSSSSSSSEYSHSKKAKRRRRSSSDDERRFSPKQSKSSKKKNNRMKNKKSKAAEKKSKEIERVERTHLYSEHGLMQLDEDCRTTAKMSARAARFAKENKPQSSMLAKGRGARQTMKSRLGGFADRLGHSNGSLWTIDTTGGGNYEDNDWSGTVVIGTSNDLEKRYLRLTTAPDPSTIRPESVLKESLEHVKRKWKENQDYFYACDQLKSIRQDLTVQRIRNDFTVYVYETHARIALEKGDHEEYNQCQSQLVQLYDSFPSAPNKIEFTAYRILYCIFTANTLDLGDVMSKLTDDVKKDECVSHALELQAAWALKNYAKFFKLHLRAPKMAGYLIDWFANRERKHALKSILKAYRPSVPTSFVKEQLGLPLDSDWTDFLSSTNLENTILYLDSPSNSKINAKDSFPLVMSALS